MARRSKWVVVIDDDEGIRDAVSELLTDEGYRVDSFKTAEEALAGFSNGTSPDLILLDYLIPMMGAERFVKELDALEVAAPILLVTAANRAHIDTGVLRIAGLVQKPFGIGTFLEQVAAAAGRRDDSDKGDSNP